MSFIIIFLINKKFLACPLKNDDSPSHVFFLLPTLLFALLFFSIFAEKLVEFLVFRRLVKVLEVISAERRRNMENVDTSLAASSGCSHIAASQIAMPNSNNNNSKNGSKHAIMGGESDDDVGNFLFGLRWLKNGKLCCVYFRGSFICYQIFTSLAPGQFRLFLDGRLRASESTITVQGERSGTCQRHIRKREKWKAFAKQPATEGLAHTQNLPSNATQ